MLFLKLPFFSSFIVLFLQRLKNKSYVDTVQCVNLCLCSVDVKPRSRHRYYFWLSERMRWNLKTPWRKKKNMLLWSFFFSIVAENNNTRDGRLSDTQQSSTFYFYFSRCWGSEFEEVTEFQSISAVIYIRFWIFCDHNLNPHFQHSKLIANLFFLLIFIPHLLFHGVFKFLNELTMMTRSLFFSVTFISYLYTSKMNQCTSFTTGLCVCVRVCVCVSVCCSVCVELYKII